MLELQKFAADSTRGDAFPLVWEKKGVHGREAGKGLRAGVNSRGQSLAISFSAQTDLQLFSHSGAELASINSSGTSPPPLLPSPSTRHDKEHACTCRVGIAICKEQDQAFRALLHGLI